MKNTVLIIFMILLNALTVMGQETRTVGRITYLAHNDGTASVTKGKASGKVIIPEEIEIEKRAYKVTSINRSAFSKNKSVTSITIPNSVTHIGSSAFRDCKSLKVVILPNRIEKIAEFVFYGCKSLQVVTLPNSVSKIEQYAFCRCRALERINIPSCYISYTAFESCNSIEKVEFSSSSMLQEHADKFPRSAEKTVSTAQVKKNDGEENKKDIPPTNIDPDVDKNIPASSAKNDKTFAVIIANENYNKEETVPYAMNDGNVFSEYCSKTLGIPVKNIHFVKDASLNDIRHEVNWITNVMEVYDGDAKAIFYYAGHGIPDEETKTSYILPVDGYSLDVKTGYSLNELYSTLGGVSSKSVIVLLDACFSGAKRDGTMLDSSRGVAIKVNQVNPIGNLIVFSASQGDETAFPYVEQGHGMFTYFILKKLQETKGNVTMGELSDYVTTQVKRESTVINNKTQHPTVIPAPNIFNSWRSEKLK